MINEPEIQVSTFEKALILVNKNGYVVIDVFCFQSFGGTTFYNLHSWVRFFILFNIICSFSCYIVHWLHQTNKTHTCNIVNCGIVLQFDEFIFLDSFLSIMSNFWFKRMNLLFSFYSLPKQVDFIFSFSLLWPKSILHLNCYYFHVTNLFCEFWTTILQFVNRKWLSQLKYDLWRKLRFFSF